MLSAFPLKIDVSSQRLKSNTHHCGRRITLSRLTLSRYIKTRLTLDDEQVCSTSLLAHFRAFPFAFARYRSIWLSASRKMRGRKHQRFRYFVIGAFPHALRPWKEILQRRCIEKKIPTRVWLHVLWRQSLK